jgi:hypothetical protein
MEAVFCAEAAEIERKTAAAARRIFFDIALHSFQTKRGCMLDRCYYAENRGWLRWAAAYKSRQLTLAA